MSKQIHFAILREYEEKQRKVAEIVAAKKKIVFREIPELDMIDSKISSIALKISKSIIQGTEATDAIKELNFELKLIRDRKSELLSLNGYGENYLESVYSCSDCKDTGYVDELYAGMKKCHCYLQRLINYTYEMSNLCLAEYENFQNFDEKLFSDEVNEEKFKINISPRQNINGIRKKCEEFVSNFDSEKVKGLLFTGQTGVGKTYMSNSIAKGLIEKGRTVLYLSAPQLFHTLKNYRTSGFDTRETDDANYDFIVDSQLLIIDDLGIEPVTTSRYAEFLTILNSRALNDNKNPCKTIISTNFTITQLKEVYNERIISRILGDFLIFKFVGDDIRLKKKWNQL